MGVTDSKENSLQIIPLARLRKSKDFRAVENCLIGSVLLRKSLRDCMSAFPKKRDVPRPSACRGGIQYNNITKYYCFAML